MLVLTTGPKKVWSIFFGLSCSRAPSLPDLDFGDDTKISRYEQMGFEFYVS